MFFVLLKELFCVFAKVTFGDTFLKSLLSLLILRTACLVKLSYFIAVSSVNSLIHLGSFPLPVLFKEIFSIRISPLSFFLFFYDPVCKVEVPLYFLVFFFLSLHLVIDNFSQQSLHLIQTFYFCLIGVNEISSLEI